MSPRKDVSGAAEYIAEDNYPIVLATKLYIPRINTPLVARPHLRQQLDMGQQGLLTIVSAPAGFGKTTLVAEWIMDSEVDAGSVAWVSLDNSDNDPIRFLTYFIMGLQHVAAQIGEAALAWLQSALDSPDEPVLTGIINDIVEFSRPITLILDDFHLITEPRIHEACSFLLENQPPNLHLIVICRADPPWPLARLRARRRLIEIRARDLRFSLAETAVFLNDIMGLHISPQDVAVLDAQTEGWITGLQLAALSMQHCADTSAFIHNFNARHVYVLDYLVEEVLEKQPAQIQNFLLETAVLERLTAPLCDAITRHQDSHTILNQLEQANLFLVPLDDERQWYRYHHLFRDLLQARLAQTRPDLPTELHRRASQWFAAANLPDEAIAHAVAADDVARAANLIEQNALSAMQRNHEVTLSHWLALLPAEVVQTRPWLCVAQAYILQWLGQRDQVERWLQFAEQSRSGNGGAADQHRLTGSIATLRAHNALIEGNIPQVVEQSELALSFRSGADDSWQGNTRVALGGAYWALGDVNAAETAFALAADFGRKVGDRMLAAPAACYVGMQQTKRGRLREAWATYQDVRALAVRSNGRPMPISGFALIKMGDLQREWNDLGAAQEYLDQGVKLCLIMNQSDVLADAYVMLARLRLALGDGPGTLKAIANADKVMTAAPVDLWVTSWCAEVRLRYWLANGDLDAAVHWARTSGLTVAGELDYHYDLHHLNLARVLLAQGRREPAGPYLAEAHGLLARILAAAEKAGWVHEAIKTLILQALAWQAQRELAEAAAVLDRALRLAEPGGYVRLFLDEGQPMRQLLRSSSSDNAGRLLAAMAGHEEAAGPPTAALADPLSQRELEVLHLLNTHLSSTEIAAELFVAPSTVRSHIKNIYSKLSVHRRAEAVVRAEELNLL